MQTVNITKIGAASLGKVSAIIYGVLGVFFGLFGILMVLTQTIAGTPITEILTISAFFILISVINTIIGFISGFLVALIFNFISGLIGGLELEVEEI